ncbi:MAG: CDP-diacylglycerol--glycerol-3-phosphate 3-phosphatidyltransferase, partial [Myxococcota bacterium]|nr:CDP-diacylglycerol--glycerol-3-phosphate 3-phosphatidyltransferase [Myxococcota bacterium]
MSLSTIRQDILNLPNILTLFRIVLIVPVCVLVFAGDPVSVFIAVLLFFIASLTDWVDGYIARRQGLVSITGKFLDPLADKLLVMAVMVMMLPMGRIPSWLVIILLARELTISGLRAIAATEGYVISAGAGGKLKTSFQMAGLLGLMVHYTYEVNFLFTTVKVSFHGMGLVLLIISAILSITSGYEYFRGFLTTIEAFQDDLSKSK